mmetsp:Transcript_8300/g.25803  ORF Transcript_8300/g.25803 Transcript_8300/m.25803 type:complete len:213 (+) Transcript_8300:370-1008(+)
MREDLNRFAGEGLNRAHQAAARTGAAVPDIDTGGGLLVAALQRVLQAPPEPGGEEYAIGIDLDYPVVAAVRAVQANPLPSAHKDKPIQGVVSPSRSCMEVSGNDRGLDLLRRPGSQQHGDVAEEDVAVAGENAPALGYLGRDQVPLVARGPHHREAEERVLPVGPPRNAWSAPRQRGRRGGLAGAGGRQPRRRHRDRSRHRCRRFIAFIACR